MATDTDVQVPGGEFADRRCYPSPAERCCSPLIVQPSRDCAQSHPGQQVSDNASHDLGSGFIDLVRPAHHPSLFVTLVHALPSVCARPIGPALFCTLPRRPSHPLGLDFRLGGVELPENPCVHSTGCTGEVQIRTLHKCHTDPSLRQGLDGLGAFFSVAPQAG